MTTTNDPTHPAYRDEADVRDELTRVFDVCAGCRKCVGLCPSFPTLFDLVDRFEDRDAGRLTPAGQDRVVDGCFQCTQCAVGCPYLPERHEWAVDVPRLMLRANAMRREAGHLTARSNVATRLLVQSHVFGGDRAVSSRVADWALGGAPVSLGRRMVATVTGVSAVRLLPPVAKQRFSSWFRARVPPAGSDASREQQGSVTVFPTCAVEYLEPRIGHDLVKVYERNSVACTLTDAGCCGAPWLHAGDVDRFTGIARTNVAVLAAEVRGGTDIVVPQPACWYVLTQHYPAYVGGPDAELVAAHTFDAAGYLMGLHHGDDTVLDTDFPGAVPSAVTYHVSCHVRTDDAGVPARELLRLTGAEVTSVEKCAAAEGVWGLLAEHEGLAIPIAERLGERIAEGGVDVIAGDCHRANTAITERTGCAPLHPLQVVARAYGVAPEHGA